MNFKNLESALNDIAIQITNAYKSKLGSSTLGNTIRVSVNHFNTDYEIVLDLQDYWKYVEEGRKPGTMPNINSILQWVRKNNIQMNTNGKLSKPAQAAYVIARSIKKKGIKPRPYLSQSIRETQNLEDILAQALAKDIENNIIKK